MTFEELVAHVAGTIGLDELAPDEDGVCSLVSESVEVALRNCPEVGMVLCTAPIAEVRPDDPPALFRRLLAANHLFVKTHGATLSVDEANGLVTLARYDALDGLTGEVFFDRLTALFATAVELQGKIDEIRSAAGADAAPPEDGFVLRA